MTGNTAKAFELLGELTGRLVQVVGEQPQMDDTGRSILASLETAVSSVVAEAAASTEAFGWDAEILDGVLSDLDALRTLETVIDLERWAEAPWWIEAAKGVIKYIKHLLPIPPKWVAIIDELLELVNKVLNWEESEPSPPTPKTPAPQPPRQQHPPIKRIEGRGIRDLNKKIEELPELPVGPECQMIRRLEGVRWRADCKGDCSDGSRCGLSAGTYEDANGEEVIVLECQCR